MEESIFKGQNGFMKGKSTTTQLTQIFHLIGESVDNHGQVDALYLDFSRAFDRVPHHLLLHKIKMYGFKGNLLKWFTSYLSGRKQRVTIYGSTSEWLSVTSGVPQGSILGPLLFFIYVNDLPLCLKDTIVALFADDCKCLKNIHIRQSCLELQNVIDSLFE